MPATPASSASDAAAVTVTPVKAWRAAEGYEALRAIADRYDKRRTLVATQTGLLLTTLALGILATAAFVARGGRWATRAEAVLAQL